MAHNIYFNENTNQHSFFTVQKKPWHGLGQIVQDYPTSSDALKFAGLDYEVAKEDIYITSKNNPDRLEFREKIATHSATIRKDTGEILGVVGKDYQIVQNIDAFKFFDAIVGGDGIQYETAGALGKGERIFITAKLPDYITVGNDDLIEKYLFLTTSHDGFGSFTAAFTPVLIVCQNTLNAAIRGIKNAVKIRHTSNAKERLEQAHTVLGITNKLSHQLNEIFNSWAKINISDPELKKLIQLAMVPNPEVLSNLQLGKDDELSTIFKNMCNNIYEYALSNPTQQMTTTRGTLFGAYNCVTGYFQNVRKYKDGESKLKSILFGGAAQLRAQTAFNLCSDIVKAGTQILHSN